MQSIKVETEKGHEVVKRVILTQIKDGTLQPGQKLPSVVELGASFGVGRSTIREALSALKATGWIEVKHGGGTFVNKILPNEHNNSLDPIQEANNLRELLEVRIWLESGCAAAAAKRRSDEDLVRIKQILDKMHHALLSNDTKLSEQADIDFHLAIAEASHNELLQALMISLTGKLAETIGKSRQLWFFEDSSSASMLYEEHANIYEAIRKQQDVEASQYIQSHLRKVEKVLSSR